MTGRGPLVVSVADLRRHLGSREPVEREWLVERLGLADVAVTDGGTVGLRGELESISDGIVLTAEVTVPWIGHCRRCLDPIEGQAAVEIREVFESHPTEGETWALDHDQIDLEPVLRDTALLALPLAPLCADDCVGPAPEEFPTRVEGEPDDGEGPQEPPPDPRWAKLAELDLGG